MKISDVSLPPKEYNWAHNIPLNKSLRKTTFQLKKSYCAVTYPNHKYRQQKRIIRIYLAYNLQLAQKL